eukprot:m.193041 g.193041  ORF g.193041 m.193041 type:complete len:120 (+) comp14875_c0_seq1:145-504(+)
MEAGVPEFKLPMTRKGRRKRRLQSSQSSQATQPQRDTTASPPTSQANSQFVQDTSASQCAVSQSLDQTQPPQPSATKIVKKGGPVFDSQDNGSSPPLTTLPTGWRAVVCANIMASLCES